MPPAADAQKPAQPHLPNAAAWACHAALIALVATVLWRNLGHVGRELRFIVNFLTIDDTYYYLNTAWLHRTAGFPTFDGINPTNGVQFLWYWILYGMGHVFAGRETFLWGTLRLCALLSGAAVALTWTMARQFANRLGALAAAAGIAWLALYRNYLIAGLENTIHLTVYLALATAYLHWLRSWSWQPVRAVRGYLLVIGLLNALVWARLDNAPISALLGLHATAWLAVRRPPRWVAGLAVAGMGSAVGAGILFHGYYAMGGYWMPVSGLFKHPRPMDWGEWGKVLAAWSEAFERIWPLGRVGSRPVLNALSLIVPVVSLAWILADRKHRRGAARALWDGVLLLIVAAVAHQLVLGWRMSHYLDRCFWYQTPQHVGFALCAAVLAGAITDWSALGRAPLRHWLGVTALGVFLLAGGYQCRRYEKDFLHRQKSNAYHFDRVRMALWVRDHLPPTARLAGYNTGELGFFSERAVTNLDGLINSYEFYVLRKRKNIKLDEYMRRQGIEYYWDYKVPSNIASRSELVHQQWVKKKGLLQLRRMLPVRARSRPAGPSAPD